jgi:hypothetical protein
MMNKLIKIAGWSGFVFGLTALIAVLASPSGASTVFMDNSVALGMSLAACGLIGILLASSNS